MEEGGVEVAASDEAGAPGNASSLTNNGTCRWICGLPGERRQLGGTCDLLKVKALVVHESLAAAVPQCLCPPHLWLRAARCCAMPRTHTPSLTSSLAQVLTSCGAHRLARSGEAATSSSAAMMCGSKRSPSCGSASKLGSRNWDTCCLVRHTASHMAAATCGSHTLRHLAWSDRRRYECVSMPQQFSWQSSRLPPRRLAPWTVLRPSWQPASGPFCPALCVYASWVLPCHLHRPQGPRMPQPPSCRCARP